jgi:hypothetical protein
MSYNRAWLNLVILGVCVCVCVKLWTEIRSIECRAGLPTDKIPFYHQTGQIEWVRSLFVASIRPQEITDTQ